MARNGLRRVVLAAAAAAATLVLLEGAARVFHRPAPVRRVWDPFAYRIPQPNLVDRFRNESGEEIEIRLNEAGMRGPRLDAPAEPGTLTLVFLGGSTTENYAFADADTFPVLLGEAVRERLGRPVRVLNAGMSAATSGTCLGRFQHQVLDLRPSAVVVMLGVNDLVGGFHTGFRRDGRHLPVPALATTRPRSHLLDLLRVDPRPRGPAGAAVRRTDFRGFPALDVFERNLRSMAAIAAAHGVPILFVTEPTSWAVPPDPALTFRMTRSLRELGMPEPDLETLVAGAARFADAVLAAPAAAGGLGAAHDLAARLEKSPRLFLDDCHYTKEGNRRVAAELLDPVLGRLSPAGLVGSRPGPEDATGHARRQVLPSP